jgi:hypothetical protein
MPTPHVSCLQAQADPPILVYGNPFILLGVLRLRETAFFG